MMRLWLVAALAVLASLLLALRAEAKPIFCPERMRYTLFFDAASYNGKPAMAGTDGRFLSDAGVPFYTTQSSGAVAAVPDAGETCAGDAKRVTVRFVDPWTGETVDAVLGETP